MQIDINFEQEDLQELYDNWGVTFDDKLDDDQKLQWFLVNYLEPFVDTAILGEINKSISNKAYDDVMKQVVIDQKVIQSKITQAQEIKQIDLSSQFGIEIAPVEAEEQLVSTSEVVRDKL